MLVKNLICTSGGDRKQACKGHFHLEIITKWQRQQRFHSKWALDRLDLAPVLHTNAITSLNSKTSLVSRRPVLVAVLTAAPFLQYSGISDISMHIFVWNLCSLLFCVLISDAMNFYWWFEKMQTINSVNSLFHHNIRVYFSSFLKPSNHFGKDLAEFGSFLDEQLKISMHWKVPQLL